MRNVSADRIPASLRAGARRYSRFFTHTALPHEASLPQASRRARLWLVEAAVLEVARRVTNPRCQGIQVASQRRILPRAWCSKQILARRFDKAATDSRVWPFSSMSVQKTTLTSPFRDGSQKERDDLRPARTTIVNEDPDGFVPQGISGEGGASNNGLDRGPLRRGSPEGHGWVDWSGLATLGPSLGDRLSLVLIRLPSWPCPIDGLKRQRPVRSRVGA